MVNKVNICSYNAESIPNLLYVHSWNSTISSPKRQVLFLISRLVNTIKRPFTKIVNGIKWSQESPTSVQYRTNNELSMFFCNVSSMSLNRPVASESYFTGRQSKWGRRGKSLGGRKPPSPPPPIPIPIPVGLLTILNFSLFRSYNYREFS